MLFVVTYLSDLRISIEILRIYAFTLALSYIFNLEWISKK